MAPQDAFIDEDDTCPLCIEEFDLSDRNFRPCPCGYQVCQFCFNNIKENMNGLCPACRRPYDEKTIQWKVVTPEEEAEFRSNIHKNQKKRAAEQRQKEVQKREAEKENRKNLVGVRVVQKNLVYVTGLQPTGSEDELLKTLRRPEFFGQYGNIQKISISNRKGSESQNPSLGIYVTFERKEDANRCIQAVNGSLNQERVLKAQLGTTKYCSTWLRHDQCTNRQCMFLHEQGDEEDSYTRQDLSSMNSIHSQRPLANAGSSRTAPRQPAPLQNTQAATPAASVSQPMVRSSSKEGSDGGDNSALPSSANWARNPPVQAGSRRGSLATSGDASSPAVSMSLPATTEAAQEAPEPAITQALLSGAPPVESLAHSSGRTPDEAPSPPKQHPTDAMMANLVKNINTCPFPFLPTLDAAFWTLNPPAFDPHGGAKRRAMREEEESRLEMEQDEQIDLPEPLEDEPESSGSLALGGEPEDREHGRESHAAGQRRESLQHLTRGGQAFFPSEASLGMGGYGTIGNRTVTPQQTLYGRPQGSFSDHLPPGISSQSNLFQGQGHNRQSSRFNFASENAANSTSVKLSANPRIMAQQSSMMPPSLHAQQANAYYGSSVSAVAGPPPGLKSSGTPPGMFGPNQMFGGASGFGAGSSKDSLINELMRSRGGPSNQGHDAGKREYLFSSFAHQFPQYPSSTSTSPAPAPGFSASLYGLPPGALQDLGSKQKKKGKKHRHANTSSSGGGAVVDLADPSILQMRQQSNAAAGQGLFGGQAQDDDNDAETAQIDEANFSVDALVSDDPLDDALSTGPVASMASPVPVVPPFGFFAGGPMPAPVFPPGLVPAQGPMTLPPGIISPFPPDFAPTQPIPQFINPLRQPVALPQPPASQKKLQGSSSRDAALAAAPSQPPQAKSILQDADFPALDTTRSTSSKAPQAAASPPAKVTVAVPGKPPGAANKRSASTSAAASIPAVEVKKGGRAGRTDRSEKTEKMEKTEKKAHPGKLNIAAAAKAVPKFEESQSAPDNSEKAGGDAASFPTLPTSATATTSTSSPIARNPPKTLRVVQTPKAEAAAILGAATNSAIEAKASGRSSVLSSNRPSTPASEVISDNASVISASISASRTSSPPPTRVGSAAVRNTTKSQQRKQRKQATKSEAAVIAAQPVPVPEAEVEIAPIIGRKKKQKKEQAGRSASTAAPAASADPESRAEASVGEEKQQEDEPATTYVKVEEKAAPKEEKAVDTSLDKGKGKATAAPATGKGKSVAVPPQIAPASVPAAPPASPVEEEEADEASKETDDKAKLTPYNMFKELIELGQVKLERTALLWNASQPHRVDNGEPVTFRVSTMPARTLITDEDHAALLAGHPVRKIVDSVRILITPNGDCVRNLSEAEENRYLELQAAIAADADSPRAFVHPRHTTSGGFSLVKCRAVPDGPPPYFPGRAGTGGDPVAKIQRDEAIYWINQYVLPRLNAASTKMTSYWRTVLTENNTAQTAGLSSIAPWIYNTGGAPPTGSDISATIIKTRAGTSVEVAANTTILGGGAGGGGGGAADTALSSTAPEDPHLFGALPPSPSSVPVGAGASMARPTAEGLGGAADQQIPLLSLEECEVALQAARKDTEKLEKALKAIINKNRRLYLSGPGGN